MSSYAPDDLIVYSNAIRRLARHYHLSWDETVKRFASNLVHVKCNVVTRASVEALLESDDEAICLCDAYAPHKRPGLCPIHSRPKGVPL